jgi:hypothetical protein
MIRWLLNLLRRKSPPERGIEVQERRIAPKHGKQYAIDKTYHKTYPTVNARLKAERHEDHKVRMKRNKNRKNRKR